jgi:hypothetical protein
MCTYQKKCAVGGKNLEHQLFSGECSGICSGLQEFFCTPPTVFCFVRCLRKYIFATTARETTQPPPKESPHRDEENDVLMS